MYNFVFTKTGEKEFLKLSSIDRERVTKKLKYLKSNLDNSNNIKNLTDMLPATHRIRIGNIRVILQKTDEFIFVILDIGYRGDIYK